MLTWMGFGGRGAGKGGSWGRNDKSLHGNSLTTDWLLIARAGGEALGAGRRHISKKAKVLGEGNILNVILCWEDAADDI